LLRARMHTGILARLERETEASPLLLPWLEQGVDGPDGVAALAASLDAALARGGEGTGA
jgi:hypothetical protein